MRTTIHDVAKISGVSISTVSAVFSDSNRISKETKLRVKTIADKLNYIPNIIGQALVTNSTKTLGVLASSDIHAPFFTDIFKGMQEVVYKHEYGILFYASSDDNRKFGSIRKLLARRVDGLILFPNPEDIEDIKFLIETKIPFALFSRHLLDDQTDYVISNHEKGAYELTSHLIKVGHRRIAYIGFPLNISTSRERITGYKKALAENGVIVDDDIIYLTPVTEIDRKLPEIISAILALKERPTAIFAVDDKEATKVIDILKTNKLRVPEDLAVAGYGNMEFAEYFDPPLTTVDQFGYEIGRQTAELLLDKIAGKHFPEPQHIVLEPKLVVRKSCGAGLRG